MTEYGDEYWKERQFSEKYYFQALIFLDHFERNFNRTPGVLDYGCGRGYFVHALRYFGAEAKGYDTNAYAVSHPFGLSEGHLTYRDDYKISDLVLCYDVLEHVPEAELPKVIGRIIDATKDMLILSVCMAGNPNFERDKTHVTKRTRTWWAHQFSSRGMVESEVPEHFMFRNQLMIFRRRP